MDILLLSHGGFCKGLLDSYGMIAGKNARIHTLSLDDDGIAMFTKRLQKITATLLKETDLLVFADIKGGTPYNEAYQLYLENSKHIRLIAGMNLPMLMEIGLTLDEHTLQSAYELAINCGKESIEGILEEKNCGNEIDF